MCFVHFRKSKVGTGKSIHVKKSRGHPVPAVRLHFIFHMWKYNFRIIHFMYLIYSNILLQYKLLLLWPTSVTSSSKKFLRPWPWPQSQKGHMLVRPQLNKKTLIPGFIHLRMTVYKVRLPAFKLWVSDGSAISVRLFGCPKTSWKWCLLISSAAFCSLFYRQLFLELQYSPQIYRIRKQIHI